MINKIGTTSGLLIGLLSIFGSFYIEGGSFQALFLIPAMMVVFGGTFAAVIISFGLEKCKKIFYLMKIAYFPHKHDVKKLIESFTQISMVIRKEGILAVEKEVEKLEHYFSKKLIRNLIDGAQADELENLAHYEIKAMQDRHYTNIFIFTKLGGYAPTMGILGTVMGLIMTLANAGSDPNLLIRSIASAFIATLWGVFSANLIWLPIGDKLRQCHLEEKLLMEVTTEGVMALKNGEIPSMIKARLISTLPQKEQAKILTS